MEKTAEIISITTTTAKMLDTNFQTASYESRVPIYLETTSNKFFLLEPQVASYDLNYEASSQL